MNRNRLHSICPYFAIFPEQFVRKHVLAHTEIGDAVFDPFSGRGTTVLESLLLDREAFGTDTNQVAVCLSNAKANPPAQSAILRRLRQLEIADCPDDETLLEDPFFTLCYHPETLKQVMRLRALLVWRTDPVDNFIAAVALGCLHGESHRTENCFSNRMPRTISTKKAYSVEWWTRQGFCPPQRDVFQILREMCLFRIMTDLPSRRGKVVEVDARQAGEVFQGQHGKVRLVVTSPPYLDTTDYSEDQWLRLWFLGGAPLPQKNTSDDRHRIAENYWRFLSETWQGLQLLLAEEATLVIRIGGARVSFDDAREKLITSLTSVFGENVTALDDGFYSEIVGRQTNSFLPNAKGTKAEYDFRYKITTPKTAA